MRVDDLRAMADRAGLLPRATARGFVCRCPAHTDANPSLSVDAGEGGRVLVRCFAGCSLGAVLAALKLRPEDLFPDNDRPLPRVARRAQTVPDPVVPTPEAGRADRIANAGTRQLDQPWAREALARRGISRDVAYQWRIGYWRAITFRGWHGAIPRVWTLPICGPDRVLRAVKLHRETPPAGKSKSLWAPIGMLPPDRPRHAWPTLWPPPEHWAADVPLVLCPGELKALAVISLGRAATAITGGESFRWPPCELRRLVRREVTLLYDDDPAGVQFRDRTLAAVGAVTRIRAGYCGRALDGRKLDANDICGTAPGTAGSGAGGSGGGA